MWRCLALTALSGMFLLVGGGSRPPVPVGERSAPVVVEAGAAGKVAAPPAAPAVPREGFYLVKKGDTLRKIAQAHGLDYRQVAAWNNLSDPGKLEVGQELRVAPPEGEAIVQPIAMPAPVTIVTEGSPPVVGTGSETLKREPRGGKVPYSQTALAEAKAMEGGVRQVVARPTEKPAEQPVQPVAPAASGEAVEWTWPAGGKVLGEFVEGNAGRESNKGIDVAGRMGEPIQAAAAGKVTFVGNLRGYGDFLVVRHNNDFISVYAHTSKILVKKDQTVARGQKIAEVGSSDADQPKLHFEIRQQGKPVDPLKLLPAR